MSGHTPGPWRAEDEGTQWAIISLDDNLIGVAYKDIKARDEEVEANARLMAAAPDLLECLTLAYEWLRNIRMVVTDETIINTQPIATKAGMEWFRRTIAKAKEG